MSKKVEFKFIEAVLIVDGQINTKRIIEVFGCGRQWASRLFKEYKENCPKNMVYKPQGAGSCYHMTDDFEAKYLKGDPEEYLACIEVVFADDQ